MNESYICFDFYLFNTTFLLINSIFFSNIEAVGAILMIFVASFVILF